MPFTPRHRNRRWRVYCSRSAHPCTKRRGRAGSRPSSRDSSSVRLPASARDRAAAVSVPGPEGRRTTACDRWSRCPDHSVFTSSGRFTLPWLTSCRCRARRTGVRAHGRSVERRAERSGRPSLREPLPDDHGVLERERRTLSARRAHRVRGIAEQHHPTDVPGRQRRHTVDRRPHHLGRRRDERTSSKKHRRGLRGQLQKMCARESCVLAPGRSIVSAREG
jgi:hypothetical protein